MSGTVGIVVIGRNEGARLATCIASVRKSAEMGAAAVVYVDSNSSDNSVEIARRAGAEVVVLDPAIKFTAARARNAGAERLLAMQPDTTYLQFIDGDTELDPTWLGHASRYLDIHPDIAVVCGRRRERHPEGSVYNLLADMEWDTPIGLTAEFGGDAMIRVGVFRKLGGYTPNFIAGEEPEFAARMRLAGCKIMRLNHEMTRHDLAMTSLLQWWRRSARSGHALAQLYHVHGGPPLLLYKKQWRSTLFWGLTLPVVLLAAGLIFSPWVLFLLPIAYGFLMARVVRYRLRHGDDRDSACTYGAFTALGKFPQLWGMATFYRNLWMKRDSRLMEYKGAAATSPAGNT